MITQVEVKKIDSTDLVIWVKGLSRFKGEINEWIKQ